MLSSVFRRLYYTSKVNDENLLVKINHKSKQVANMPDEEIKGKSINSIYMSNRQEEKSPSQIHLDLGYNSRNQQTSDENHK